MGEAFPIHKALGGIVECGYLNHKIQKWNIAAQDRNEKAWA
jgi:hypothetical protein